MHKTPDPMIRTRWLRQGMSHKPRACGNWNDLSLANLGAAATRETFTTATLPLATAWTNLFRSMLASKCKLRWQGSGPGVGRDARIAYSGLLGRYMAREYLTRERGVQVLIPLEEARRVLKNVGYEIRKHPSSPGLEADWIGLDSQGLIIAEAKGSFNSGVKRWRGPDQIPDILETAINQADRTAVFRVSETTPLPAKRFAVASRWANEENCRDPALLAWQRNANALGDDYMKIAKCLHRTDLEAVLIGLGHSEAVRIIDSPRSAPDIPGYLRLRVGRQKIEPGFTAVLGLFGVYPLHRPQDLTRLRRLRRMRRPPMFGPEIVFVSLSSHYISKVIANPRATDEFAYDHELPIARQAGLTFAWLSAHDHIASADD